MSRDISEWLQDLGLGSYTETFVENGVDLRALPHLDESDLKELGVLLGHRRVLLAAIASLQDQQIAPPNTRQASELSLRPAAERRHVTVMFCDLVGSTVLSEHLDPEDLRDIIQNYQNSVAGEVARFDGHIAKFMGDGVLIYFGYPSAHEDDAERTVRAALAVRSAVSGIETSQSQALSVRIGIATGLVVIGDLIGTGASQEEVVTGKTPNLAARLQELGAPNTVVICRNTRELLGEFFELEDLGLHALKGFAHPTHAWSVLGERTVTGRFEAVRGRRMTRLVGREHELSLLLERWTRAQAREGQVVLLSGEAGIGKSRLTRALIDAIGEASHTRLRYQCSPHHMHSMLHPFIVQLESAAKFDSGDSADVKRAKLEVLLQQGTDDTTLSLPLIAELLSVPLNNDAGTRSYEPQQQKQLTFQALFDQLSGLSRRCPVLLIFEDAHWADPSSQELLDRMVSEISNMSVLILVTHRPEYQTKWAHHAHVMSLTLSRLSRANGRELVEASGGLDLPDDVIQDIVDRTDGVPLFVEELTRSMVETGQASADSGIPATLQASLIARLDRLGKAKEMAQLGAVIGRDFAFQLLAKVARQSETELLDELDILVQSGLIFQRGTPPGATYTFKHALVQDAAYESLLRRRKEEIHGRVAEAIIDNAPQIVASEPELIAHHLTQAGKRQDAFHYWRTAGDLARRRSAHKEAVAHVERALALIDSLPDRSQRQRLELALRRDLGSSLMLTKGFASRSVGEAHTRYFELCETYGAQDQVAFALHGLYHYHFVRAEPAQALTYGNRFHELAKEAGDEYYLAQAHFAIGGALLMEGRFSPARDYLERALEIYSVGRHDQFTQEWGYDLGIFCRGFLSHTLWHLGFPDQAQTVSEQGLVEADSIEHPFSKAVALSYRLMLLQFCRLPDRLREAVGQLEQLCDEYGFAYYRAWAGIMRGWAETVSGVNADALNDMRAALADLQATDARTRCTYYLGLIAEQLLTRDDPGAADDILRQAEATLAASDERWYAADISRIRGLLELNKSGDAQTALMHLKKSRSIAGEQSARAMELRAATGGARILQSQGNILEARQLLEPICDWFAEGLELPDMKTAKDLLNSLN